MIARQTVVVVLLVLGAVLWIAIGEGRGIGAIRWGVIAAAALAGLLLARPINAALDRIRHPSRRGLVVSAAAIGIVAACYLITSALVQDRDLFPKTNDDCSYFLGTQMLAHGRLRMLQHPLADFFESFYILVRPVYCSIYFPGTALMFVPTVWLSLPTSVVPVALSGAIIGLLYAITTELIDGAAGVLAALMVVSLTWFRTLSVMVMSQIPMLLLGLLMVLAWLRWRRNFKWGWALALGVFAGWAAIVRPVDAVVFAVPIGIAMTLDLWKQKWSRRAVTAGLVVAGTLPFFTVQVVFDLRTTGHAFKTPYTLYLNEQVPGGTFGFHRFDPNARPQSSLPQVQADYELTRSYLELHQPDNFLAPWFHTQFPAGFAPRPPYLAMIADTTLPIRALLSFVPVGLLSLTHRRRWVLWGTLPVFLALYLCNPFFLEHYAIAIIPAMVLWVLLGFDAATRAWPRHQSRITGVATALVVAASLTSLWEINHLIVRDPSKQVSDEPLPSALLRKAHELLRGERAVVLFRYSPKQNWKAEPVYNSEVVWPDDAEVVRAHDLGARDSEIVDYYAQTQPDRVFFVWDLGKDELRRIGTAASLREAERRGENIDRLLHPSTDSSSPH